MDPNANLEEQDTLLAASEAYDLQRRAELRRALLGWLVNGGFEPNWKAHPDASKAFRKWRVKFGKFQDLAR